MSGEVPSTPVSARRSRAPWWKDNPTLVALVLLVALTFPLSLPILIFLRWRELAQYLRMRNLARQAHALGVASNEEVFAHPLNRAGGAEARDPRSAAQRNGEKAAAVGAGGHDFSEFGGGRPPIPTVLGAEEHPRRAPMDLGVDRESRSGKVGPEKASSSVEVLVVGQPVVGLQDDDHVPPTVEKHPARNKPLPSWVETEMAHYSCSEVPRGGFPVRCVLRVGGRALVHVGWRKLGVEHGPIIEPRDGPMAATGFSGTFPTGFRSSRIPDRFLWDVCRHPTKDDVYRISAARPVSVGVTNSNPSEDDPEWSMKSAERKLPSSSTTALRLLAVCRVATNRTKTLTTKKGEVKTVTLKRPKYNYEVFLGDPDYALPPPTDSSYHVASPAGLDFCWRFAPVARGKVGPHEDEDVAFGAPLEAFGLPQLKKGTSTVAAEPALLGLIFEQKDTFGGTPPEEPTVTLHRVGLRVRWSMVVAQNELMLAPAPLRASSHAGHFSKNARQLAQGEFLFEETHLQECAAARRSSSGGTSSTLDAPLSSVGSHPVLGTELIAYSPFLPYLLRAVRGEFLQPRSTPQADCERFMGLCFMLGAPLNDRSKTFHPGLKLKITHPIPDQVDFEKAEAAPTSLEELLLQRARQILQDCENWDSRELVPPYGGCCSADGRQPPFAARANREVSPSDVAVEVASGGTGGLSRRPGDGEDVEDSVHSHVEDCSSGVWEDAPESRENIYLLWSGGIDTTAIVCAFLRVMEENDHLRKIGDARVVVAYCERSVREYPWFARNVLGIDVEALFGTPPAFLGGESTTHFSGSSFFPSTARGTNSVPVISDLFGTIVSPSPRPSGASLRPFVDEGRQHLADDRSGKLLRTFRFSGHVRDFVDGRKFVVSDDPCDMLMGTYVMADFCRPFLAADTGVSVRAPKDVFEVLFGPWMRKRVSKAPPVDSSSARILGAKTSVYQKKESHPLYGRLAEPWPDVLPDFLAYKKVIRRDRGKGEAPLEPPEKLRLAQPWIGFFRRLIENAPPSVRKRTRSMFDLLWWLTYCCKYEHDLLRVLYNRDPKIYTPGPDGNLARLFRSVRNFYEHPSFDVWSLSEAGHAQKMPCPKLWATYKLPLKTFIFSYTGDAEYYRYKTKNISVRNSWGYEMGICSQFSVLKWGKYSSSMKKMDEKYGVGTLEQRFVEEWSPGQSGPLRAAEFERVARNLAEIRGRDLAAGMALGAGAAGFAICLAVDQAYNDVPAENKKDAAGSDGAGFGGGGE